MTTAEEAKERKSDGSKHMDVKQVIIMRRDLGMRRGKEIAQGSHASIAFLTKAVHQSKKEFEESEWTTVWDEVTPTPHRLPTADYTVDLPEPAWKWIDESFAKVTLQARDEQTLLDIYDEAKKRGILAHLITDTGRTEFHGELTNTCLAIGPDYVDVLDELTGPEGLFPLKLY